MKNSISELYKGPRAALLTAPLALLACRELIQKQIHYVYLEDTGQGSFEEEEDVEVIFPEDTGEVQDSGEYGSGTGTDEDSWLDEDWYSDTAKYQSSDKVSCEAWMRDTSSSSSLVLPFPFYESTTWGPIVVNDSGFTFPVEAYPHLDLRESEYFFICPGYMDAYSEFVPYNAVSEVKYEAPRRSGDLAVVEWYSNVFAEETEVLIKWGVYDSRSGDVFWRAPDEGDAGAYWECRERAGGEYYCEDQALTID